jgi:hypothetical protein
MGGAFGGGRRATCGSMIYPPARRGNVLGGTPPAPPPGGPPEWQEWMWTVVRCVAMDEPGETVRAPRRPSRHP